MTVLPATAQESPPAIVLLLSGPGALPSSADPEAPLASLTISGPLPEAPPTITKVPTVDRGHAYPPSQASSVTGQTGPTGQGQGHQEAAVCPAWDIHESHLTQTGR